VAEPLEHVRPGLTGRTEVVVTRELTVGAVVDGMPLVYGTPMMILAMEIASGEAVKGHLPEGRASSAAPRRRDRAPPSSLRSQGCASICYEGPFKKRGSPHNAGEGRERPMLERVQDAPAHAPVLRASGSILAREIEAAIEEALGQSDAATGLVIVIDPDFGGYFAELARGLTNASLAHKSLVKLAVVTDAERMDEAKLSGFDVSPVPVRLFASADRKAALDWAAAARRGE
jgi:hypothetical protein